VLVVYFRVCIVLSLPAQVIAW